MFRAIIDTNVLVRATIKNTGSDYLVFKAFLDNRFELLYSEMLIRELDKVLNYPRIFNKYGFTKRIIAEFIESLVTFGKLVYCPKKVKICRDPEDDELLSIALAIVHKPPVYIVTGDKDLLELEGKCADIKILKADLFLKKIKQLSR